MYSREIPGKNLLLRTYGCAMNAQDSLRIEGLLAREGWRLVEREEDADVVIVNTCAVRETSEQKIFGELGRLRRLRDARPGFALGVGGCVAQELGAEFLRKVPHLDFVFGTHAIHRLPQTLARVREGGERVVDTGLSDDPEAVTGGLYAALRGPRAYVNVMQGCNMACAFCIVPQTRGREIYRAPEAIVEEAAARVREGAREIHLLGQTVNSYWYGTSKRADFADLLGRVAAVPGLARLRFSTSHPLYLSDALIDAFATLAPLCEALHLPVQSGADRMLRAMRRGYTASWYANRIAALREAVPGIALSTDVIVGFPGETEGDFAATMDLLEGLRFDAVYSFKFSPRPGTDAAGLPDQVPEGEKDRRLWTLQARQDDITAERLAARVGGVEEVLVEGPSKLGRGRTAGRTRGNLVVLLEDESALPGDLIPVRIDAASRHTLQGTRALRPRPETEETALAAG